MAGIDPITVGISAVMDVVKRIWPEPMSKEKEAEVEQNLKGTFRKFVVEYEGSAKDYKGIPFVGPIILLSRGLIRPVWTVTVMYYNWIYFTGTNVEAWTTEKWKLLLINTVLVLIFWFGERAVKNVMPFLMELFKGK